MRTESSGSQIFFSTKIYKFYIYFLSSLVLYFLFFLRKVDVLGDIFLPASKMCTKCKISQGNKKPLVRGKKRQGWVAKLHQVDEVDNDAVIVIVELVPGLERGTTKVEG